MSSPVIPLREMTVLGGRYRVLRPLGSGGSAEVYLAEQLSLQRKVALKVITRQGPPQPEAQARFKREALIHSTIDHPAVVRILDFETDGPEGTVVVLEYVDGVRLDEAIAGHPMEPREATRLLLQLAEGLAAIHGKGVVHRDFKAENVMLSQGASGRQARILDFGLARLFDADQPAGDGRNFVTHAGLVAGTPAYLAPEQLRGMPADPRTDVYAFGVTAYFMLAGELPFPGPELRDYLAQHLEQKAPSLRGRAPEALAELVARCLEKEPARRPADGLALAAELGAMSPLPAARPAGSSTPALLLVVLSLIVGAAPFLGVERPWEPRGQASWLLRLGLPALALERLGPDDPATASLRALALEALGRRDELAKLLRERCLPVVSGLAPEDRARLQVSYLSCAR